MKDNKLLTYYSVLALYLIIGFFLNTNLRIMANALFCLLSASFYYSEKKSTLNPQDNYFIISLVLAVFSCLSARWRYIPIGIPIEMFFSTLMLIFLILSLKNPNQYLFLGRKWALMLGVILILLSILYFTNHFLPFISDINIPISLLFIFVLGFVFIIILIRVVNHQGYLLHFFGICSIITSCIVAAFSIYHNTFPLHNFLEDALSIIGVGLLTIGMLKRKNTKIAFDGHQDLSLLHFLKKIFS